jgi:hypothetical protein
MTQSGYTIVPYQVVAVGVFLEIAAAGSERIGTRHDSPALIRRDCCSIVFRPVLLVITASIGLVVLTIQSLFPLTFTVCLLPSHVQIWFRQG